MAFSPHIFSLFSLSAIALFICAFQTAPVAALTVEHAARALSHPAHDALAMRKRSASANTKRCKPRPAPSSAPISSSSASSSPAPSPAPALSTSSAPSPSPAPVASPAPSNPSSNGKNQKAGVGWPNGDDHLDQWAGLVNTIYTWGPSCPPSAAKLGIQCCPMLWGWDQVDQWVSTVMNTSPSCVMGPNEPEIAGQSNMSPQSAVDLWYRYIKPMQAKGAFLVSPATTSDPEGTKWMQEFIQLCGPNCGIGAMGKHYYDISADGLISLLEDHHKTFNMPIWLTEFACQNFNGGPQCSMSQVWEFQGKATSFLKSTSYIDKYMPFGAMQNLQGVNPDNSLMNPDFSPNDLARAYLS